jgi:hypothetical protein
MADAILPSNDLVGVCLVEPQYLLYSPSLFDGLENLTPEPHPRSKRCTIAQNKQSQT